jgi:hypothetical protein
MFKPDELANINGTHFHGLVIEATYAEMEAKLGLPHCHNGDNTTTEWFLTDEEDNVVVVYDWNSLENAVNRSDKITWHIGAHSKMIAWKFYDWFKGTEQ